MNYIEFIFSKILTQAKVNECDLIEATIDFCTENDVEIEDLIGKFDLNMKQMLQTSALYSNRIRKKDYGYEPIQPLNNYFT
jgi:hypothetical protein